MQNRINFPGSEQGQAGPGSMALSVLANPLKALTLRAHQDRPLRFRDLEDRLSWAARTSLRVAVTDLRRMGALERCVVRAMPRAVENELTDAGRDLIFVDDVLERWLELSPMDDAGADSAVARSAVSTLTAGWDSGAVRTLAEQPISLTELSITLGGLTYHSLERRLVKMRAAGQIEPVATETRSVPYTVTDWLRHAVAPLSAAARWERLHLPGAAKALTRRDAEATLLLALPLAGPPRGLNGECAFAVTTAVGKSPGHDAKVVVNLRAGPNGIVPCPVEPRPRDSAAGSPDAWHHAIVDGDQRELCLCGPQPGLLRAIVDAIHASLNADR